MAKQEDIFDGDGSWINFPNGCVHNQQGLHFTDAQGQLHLILGPADISIERVRHVRLFKKLRICPKARGHDLGQCYFTLSELSRKPARCIDRLRRAGAYVPSDQALINKLAEVLLKTLSIKQP